MRNKFLLFNVVFIFSLIILFLNDHFLKLYFHNWFTGKLSDVVGIILIPFLLTYLFPKLRQNSVYIATLFFTFWKSPFSEKFIEFYNLLSPISIHRIVDYTDLFALFFLIVPYYFIKNKGKMKLFEIRKIPVACILVPSVFVLMSTSPPRYYNYTPYTGNITFSNFKVTMKGSREDLLEELKSRNISFRKDTVRIISYNKMMFLMRGKVETSNINSDKDLLKISQDTLKNDIKRVIDDSNWFIIDSLKLDDESIKNIQFQIGTYSTDKGKESVITINGLTTKRKTDENAVRRKLKKIYRKALKNEFSNY